MSSLRRAECDWEVDVGVLRRGCMSVIGILCERSRSVIEYEKNVLSHGYVADSVELEVSASPLRPELLRCLFDPPLQDPNAMEELRT